MSAARKKNIKKKFNNNPNIKNKALLKILKKAVIAGVACFVIFAAARNAVSLIKTSSYFTLNHVRVSGADGVGTLNESEVLMLCKTRNIFSVDIEVISRKIRAAHPELQEVTVGRVLPDTLAVRVISRTPFAVLKLREDYAIDKFGVVFSGDITRYRKKIPHITGISSWARPVPGEYYKSKQLDVALSALKMSDDMSLFKRAGIASIDVSNMKDLKFYLDNGLEIKMGSGDIKDKLIKLSRIFKDPGIDINNLKYIDLRFDSAVFQPK